MLDFLLNKVVMPRKFLCENVNSLQYKYCFLVNIWGLCRIEITMGSPLFVHSAINIAIIMSFSSSL
jgi:hypothetical protein